MKKLIVLLLLAAMTLVAVPMAAAQHGKTMKKAPMAMATKAFACPHCEVASDKAGKCPTCPMQMMAVNGTVSYGCAHCKTTSMKPGKCTSCGMAMKKNLTTYACEDCKVTSTKPGNCRMCKHALKKHVLAYK